MTEGTTLILANGSWDNIERLRRIADGATSILAADGAWAKAQRLRIRVDRVFGDLDSLTISETEALEESGTPLHAFAAAKDWIDLELALDYALAQKPSRIVLFGASGGRLDHTLAGLFLLEKGVDAEVPIESAVGRATLRLVAGRCDLPDARIADRVSLLPVSASATVRTGGLSFALRGEPLYRAASRGVSNEVCKPPAWIEVTDGRLLVIHEAAEEGGG